MARARTTLRRLLAVGLLLALLGLVAAAGVNLTLTSRVDRIDGAFDDLGRRPPAAPGETILMVGTRPGGGRDIAWLPGEQARESVMLVEVEPDGRSVTVVSLALGRDATTDLDAGPASSAVSRVESATDRRVDLLMAIDWRTFAALAADNHVDATYRWGSAPAAQHAYLRTVLEGTLHAELRKQPHNLLRALWTTASGVAIDDTWSVLELDRLVLGLRDLRSAEIRFATVPR